MLYSGSPRMSTSRIVVAKMPTLYVEYLDELVRMGRYASRSEAIRAAVRMLIEKEFRLHLDKLNGEPNTVNKKKVKRVRIG